MTPRTRWCPGCRLHEIDYRQRVCTPCEQALHAALHSIVRLMPELEVTITRRDRILRAAIPRERPGAGVDEWRATLGLVANPLPVNVNALQVKADVTGFARRWAHVFGWMRTRGPACPQPGDRTCTHASCRTDTRPACRRPDAPCGHETCRLTRADDLMFLIVATPEILRQAACFRMLKDARAIATRVEQCVDRPDPGVYGGQCPAVKVAIGHDVDTDVITFDLTDDTCGADLFGRESDEVVVCIACGSAYPLAGRQEALTDVVADQFARPAVIASALTAAGRPLPAARLDNWIAADKRLARLGQTRADGLPLILPVLDEVWPDDWHPPLAPMLIERDPREYLVGAVVARFDAYARKTAAREAARLENLSARAQAGDRSRDVADRLARMRDAEETALLPIVERRSSTT